MRDNLEEYNMYSSWLNDEETIEEIRIFRQREIRSHSNDRIDKVENSALLKVFLSNIDIVQLRVWTL